MEKKIYSLNKQSTNQPFKKEVKLTFKYLRVIHCNIEGSPFDSFYSLVGYLERAVSVFSGESNIYMELSRQEKETTYMFFNVFLYSLKKMYACIETYKPNDFLNECTQEEESDFYKFIDCFINDWAKEFEKHRKMILHTYLSSKSANEWDERNNVLWAFKNLDFYFKSMVKHLPK